MNAQTKTSMRIQFSLQNDICASRVPCLQPGKGQGTIDFARRPATLNTESYMPM